MGAMRGAWMRSRRVLLLIPSTCKLALTNMGMFVSLAFHMT